MLIWWGPEFTMFYNDAFVPLAGAKHPVGLGQPGWEMFAEIWPTSRECWVPTWVNDQLLVMNRPTMARAPAWSLNTGSRQAPQ